MDWQFIAIGTLILLSVFLIATIIGLARMFRRYHWEHLSATIVDFKITRAYESITTTLTLEYFQEGSQILSDLSTQNINENTLAKGDTIQILVDPDRPHRCVLDEDGQIYEIIPFLIAKAVVARREKSALKQRIKT